MTVTRVEPSIPSSSAVIVVASGFLVGVAKSSPLLFGDSLLMMCAAFVLEEVQSTCDVTFCVVPSEKTAVATICICVPPAIVGLAGVTVSAVRAGEVTVAVVEP